MRDSFILLVVFVFIAGLIAHMVFMFIAGLITHTVTQNELHCPAPQTLLVETTNNAKIARCVDVRGDAVK